MTADRLFVALAFSAALVAVTPAPTTAQAAGPRGPIASGDELRVWLITIGPGDAVWESYGHNAIRVLDTRTGRDVAYNWGIFDFAQGDFITRFLQGRMLYQMAVFPARTMVRLYEAANREVIQQELNLTPEQARTLQDLAETNALPENREYIYQYFRDNCSTRVRDLLDRVLGGGLRAEFEKAATGNSYRYHSRRLTRLDPLVFTGQDLLLGTPTDTQISRWDEMFLPMTLRDAVRTVHVSDSDGQTWPLVLAEEVVAATTRTAEPSAPPRWLLFYLSIGTLVGGVLASLASSRVHASATLRRSILGLSTVWSVLAGALGSILVLLLFTDHSFAYWNENLFLFHPLSLVLAGQLPCATSRSRWGTRARKVSLVIAAVGVLGLIWQLAPASRQENAIFFAAALPVHLGLALGVWRSRHRDRPQPKADVPVAHRTKAQ